MNRCVTVSIKGKNRESNFELLRIVAQYMIVFYHLFFHFTKDYQDIHPIFKGIQIPLHIGVVIFILISGYFGIKPSVKGGVKLLAMTALYYIPLELIVNIHNAQIKDIIKDFLFVSLTPYWFVRTYFFLYLLSPMVNNYLDQISKRERIVFIIILGYMAVWMGTIHSDSSLSMGKNVINFIFIYVIGNTLCKLGRTLNNISITSLLLYYSLFNSLIVLFWLLFHNSLMGSIIWELSFWYSSPFLIGNAILLFLVFSKLHFSSRIVNYCASSVFAIYLIHCHPLILENLIGKGVSLILSFTEAKAITTILCFIFYAFGITIMCIFVDKLLSPLWKFVSRISEVINDRVIKI